MSPDFIYFLRLRPAGDFGHTLPGLFLFCLPAGFVIIWVYHVLLERPLNALLPTRLSRPAKQLSWSLPHALVMALSLLLGAATHILWDAFTHEQVWGVTRLPWLQWQLFPQNLALPLYKLTQHGSSLIGLVVILIWLSRRPYSTHSYHPAYSERQKAVGWFVLSGVSLGAGILYSLSRAPASLSAFVGPFVVSSLTSLFLVLCLFAVIWHIRRAMN